MENGRARQELEATGRGFIYAFWHGRQVLLLYLHRGDHLRPLISQSVDGEIVARICQGFGLDPVRGSSSRGGVVALLEIKKSLEAGFRVAISPDGPRGPLRKIQGGILYAAQKTQLPILPVSSSARRKWIFRGWDEFFIPKPFNRLSIVYGEPISVGLNDDLAERAVFLENALNAITAKADELAG